jgi:hypothetical protein
VRQFVFDRRQALIDQVIQQAALQGIEDFAASCKPVSAQQGQLVLVLFVLQFVVLVFVLDALDGLVFLPHRIKQLSGQLAQLPLAERLDIWLCLHGGHCARRWRSVRYEQ